MSTKINIIGIIKDNYSTYVDENGDVSKSDWMIMILFPFLLSLTSCIYSVELTTTSFSNIITACSIFTALLLNLLILIYEQKIRHIEKKLKYGDEGYEYYLIRSRVINEVHYNISYCIIISILTLVIASVGNNSSCGVMHTEQFNLYIDLNIWLISFSLIFLCSHIILTLLMILKRVHILIVTH